MIAITKSLEEDGIWPMEVALFYSIKSIYQLHNHGSLNSNLDTMEGGR